MQTDIELIEIKVRLVDDFRLWSDIPITRVVEVIGRKEAYNVAKTFLPEGNNVYEVRWNFANSPQGHYVPSNSENRARHRAIGQLHKAFEATDDRAQRELIQKQINDLRSHHDIH